MSEPTRQQNRAFTLIELIFVMAIIAILAVLLLPALERARKRSKRAVCMGNLKQIGAAYYIFKHDHEDRIPAAVPVGEGGVKEFFFTPIPTIRPGWETNVFRIFQAMSNILGSPKILVCPADRGRTPVDTFPELKPYLNWHHPHVTYSALVAFLGRGEGPKVLYGGDSAPHKDFLKEHLTTFAGEGEKLAILWMWGTHTDIGGNMLFGDGRVEVVPSDRYYRYSSEGPIMLGTPNVSVTDLGPPQFASEATLTLPQAPSAPPNRGAL